MRIEYLHNETMKRKINGKREGMEYKPEKDSREMIECIHVRTRAQKILN